MSDYKKIRKRCELNSMISERVVDDFLLHFAARHQGLEKKMNTQFGWYRDVLQKLDKSTVEFLKSQYIIHRVFRENGLIGKFLKHPGLKHLKGPDREFLEQHASVPWRFSFAEVVGRPAEDFFEMRDVFSEEEYLLFSPGMSDIAASNSIMLWFNLVGFNGLCWQSFGPIGAFQSFDTEDILFFATERNPDIEGGEDVCADIEKDPLPYMMLITGAAYPRTFKEEDEMIYLLSEHDLDSLDTGALKKAFVSEYDDGIYRLTHKDFGEFPHFAVCYFDEEQKILLFTAMTERGFGELIKTFNSFGYDYPDLPYLRVRPQMITAAESILKKKIEVNEYHDRFETTPDPADSEFVDHMNDFMALVLPDINAGRKPDIAWAAEQTGVPLETAEDMVSNIFGSLDKLPDVGGARKGKNPPVKNREQDKREKNSNEGTRKTVPRNETSLPDGAGSEPFSITYHTAREIRNLEPWKYLYESEVFGIEIPGTDRVYFISVMGSNGEYTAIAAYKGYKGLFDFMNIADADETPPLEAVMTLPHLMVSFTDRELMEKEDLDAIKKSGEKFRGTGNWPKLEDIEPGYVPVYPEGDALDDLQIILEQAFEVLSVAVVDPDYLKNPVNPERELLIRRQVEEKGALVWTDRFEAPDPKLAKTNFKLKYNTTLCEKISHMKVEDSVIQVDLFILPAPVKEGGSKGYFPFVLILVDASDGRIVGMNMLSPTPDLHTMHESVPQMLLEELDNLGFRPERIELHTELLYSLTENALKKSYCMSVLQEEMPMVDEARESLVNQILEGGMG